MTTRLFVAIDFDEKTKAALDGVVRGFRRVTAGGTFTRRENHHLTLAFLGETEGDRVPEIRQAMAACADRPAFSLETDDLGVFRREGGDIYWIGLKPSPPLEALQGDLAAALGERGFPLEQRAFRPHLTLGRQVVPGKGFDRVRIAGRIPKLRIDVARITLMESRRIEGRLTYRPVEIQEFGG